MHGRHQEMEAQVWEMKYELALSIYPKISSLHAVLPA